VVSHHEVNRKLATERTARRRRLGWTQHQLAEASGLSASVIAKLETSRTPYIEARHAAIEQALAQAEADALAHWIAVAEVTR
jgi:transcriptional regulator with XRE-family HTH domain